MQKLIFYHAPKINVHMLRHTYFTDIQITSLTVPRRTLKRRYFFFLSSLFKLMLRQKEHAEINKIHMKSPRDNAP